MVQQYGKPSWENAYLHGFGQQQDFIIPLEQNGKIKTIVKYAYNTINSNELIPELVNENSIEKSNTIDRYKNSFLFYNIHKRKPNVVDESVLKFAQDAIDNKAKVLKSEILNNQKNKSSLTKKTSSTEIQLTIELDMSSWYMEGQGCNLGITVTKYELERELNRYINYLNYQVLDQTFVPESVYVDRDVVHVSMMCLGDQYFELGQKVRDLMDMYNSTLTSIGRSLCDAITFESPYLSYLYYMDGGTCDLGNPWNDPLCVQGGGGVVVKTIEEKIDDSLLDDCTKDVLHKLENLTGGGDILKMLERFSPEGSIYDINMSIGAVTSSNNLAETTKASTYGVNMVFNEDYIKGIGNSSRPTDLSVATTMAHEIIHAYLISLLNESRACGSSTILDFPTVYDAYQNCISSDPAEHELIAMRYVNAIAATIQEFHTGKPVELGKATEVYTDLAWAGLSKTDYFNTKYPDDPNSINYKERVRILNRFTNEKNFENRGEQTPVGTPCQK